MLRKPMLKSLQMSCMDCVAICHPERYLQNLTKQTVYINCQNACCWEKNTHKIEPHKAHITSIASPLWKVPFFKMWWSPRTTLNQNGIACASASASRSWALLRSHESSCAQRVHGALKNWMFFFLFFSADFSGSSSIRVLLLLAKSPWDSSGSFYRLRSADVALIWLDDRFIWMDKWTIGVHPTWWMCCWWWLCHLYPQAAVVLMS